MAALSLLEPTSSVLLSAHSMQAEEIPRAIRRAHRRCAYDCGLLQRPPASCIAGVAVIGFQSHSFSSCSNTRIPLLKRRVVQP